MVTISRSVEADQDLIGIKSQLTLAAISPSAARRIREYETSATDLSWEPADQRGWLPRPSTTSVQSRT